MQFQNKNLRNLPEDFEGPIRTRQTLTLIVVDEDGMVSFANTATGKDIIIDHLHEGELLMMAWNGQYRTDIFLLTAADIEKHYK